jgi:acetylornithine/succinyldiaminopimelate/putrescine aminotransferase
MAAKIREGIEKLMEKHPGFLIQLRQQGLMMGLKLKDEYSGPVLTKTAYDNGLLLIYANNDTSVCQFLPPLIITTDQIPEILTKLDKALGAARRLRPLVKMSKQIKKLVAPIKQLLHFNGN